MENDDYFNENDEYSFENILQPERAVRDRVEFRTGQLGTFMDDKTKQFQNRFGVKVPLEKFLYQLEAIFNNLKNQNILRNVNSVDVQNMTDFASRLKNIEFKNVISYILGYMCFKNSGMKKLKPVAVKGVFSLLPLINEPSIKPADILRYARLWEMKY